MSQLAYRRILLKLSGEALMGGADYGIDPAMIGRLATEVIEAQQAGFFVQFVFVATAARHFDNAIDDFGRALARFDIVPGIHGSAKCKMQSAK